ncbi:Uncharacterized protein dnm_026060 [Desulfonema magnum]|uniref:Uncharacterized protein n=1 Tax=Desulfonema magnum TaxID=45655 RepID=A0A975BJU2_9BACT|nr:Uncharacterized protein dnm_026060 [Desulfonema magnum]
MRDLKKGNSLPGNELQGYSQSSLRDLKKGGIRFPAMNYRAILSRPSGT